MPNDEEKAIKSPVLGRLQRIFLGCAQRKIVINAANVLYT